ncbi:uncharacterized protein OCT59_006337 [Rhizophagus irregularis]|nr:hypothetical protein OCT59_006337 [Rhizophagus irregularis]
MNENSNQSESHSQNTVSALENLEIDNSISCKQALHVKTSRHSILLKLEVDGFITPDKKVKELIKELTGIKYLFNLKLLFEDLQNEFSNQVLIDSLVALADPAPFNLYYSKEGATRLEVHLRTLIAVLERICFSPIRLTKNFRDKIYDSLTKFAEIHRKTTQVIEEGLENNFRSNFNQFNQQKDDKSDEKIAKKRNYNIDFLLIHLRDTLHSLRDDETSFQEFIRRSRDLLKTALNITPGILTITGVNLPNDNCSILSMLNQLRQSLSFKYPVASYYVDWRILLIIQHNLFIWSECSEKIISKKFGEILLMEFIWSFLEREWINITNKSILDSQPKFDEVSNKVIKALKSAGSFLSDLSGNEPLALPYALWFGLLDLAHSLIQKSTIRAIHGLCYYLAIESLNKAPSSFIQFKAIEILLYLHNNDSQMFSMINDDFDHYIQMLSKNNSVDSSEKFQKLLKFVKDKYLEDLKILNDDIGKEKKGKGKEKGSNQNTYIVNEQTSNSNILDAIADEMTCLISMEPIDQICILICQHTLSLNNLKLLKQKICPKCREKIEENDIRYLPQHSIYKNLYTKFSESGYISPPIELENSNQIYNSDDSGNSEAELILNKKEKILNIKLNSNISLSSILSRFSKKQHPKYQSIIKELNEKHYKKAETLCKELLNFYPKSYSLRCILGYIYRCLNNYDQAHLYLKEAIDLKQKEPIAYFICGEIFFQQNEYSKAINNLERSLFYNVKINNSYIVLGNSNFFEAESYNYDEHYLLDALKNYEIALKNDPNNYLCLKSCAYIYDKNKDYFKVLIILDRLLNINNEDSLILCYYGEVLCKIGLFSDTISYFTKANDIDPENIHNLNKKAIAYYTLQDYGKALFELDKVIQLDPLNSLVYYLKCLIYYTKKDIDNAIMVFEKCKKSLDLNDILAKTLLFHLEYLLNRNNSTELNNILTRITNQISNIDNIENSRSLLFIRCKIYIDLKMYHEAKSDLDMLYHTNRGYFSEYIPYIYLLQEHEKFWSHLNNYNNIDLSKFGIVNDFSKYINASFLMTNLVNLDNKLGQFQESDTNSLSEKVIDSKNEKLYLDLPTLNNNKFAYVIWKINIKKILPGNCFIKFNVEKIDNTHYEHILKHEDILKLEGLGWIEYQLPKCETNLHISIEVNGPINVQIDYVRFGYNNEIITYIPNMGDLLPNYHKVCPNVPEIFKDKYFSRKEMENLLELKDIINHL